MANAMPEIVDPPVGSPIRPRGLLAVAAPAPDGWELGGVQFSVACPTPVIRDKCITIEGGDQPTRPNTATFPVFIVEQGVECSTLSGDARAQEARDALTASTEYALGRTLADGVASGASHSLADAEALGDFANAVAAVAAIECAAAEAGAGAEYMLHGTPAAAAALAATGLVDAMGRSPMGAPWAFSPGYACAEDGGDATIWATGRVIAAAGAVTVNDQVDHLRNNREAWAVRAAVIGFNPCINLSAAFPITPGG